MKEGKRENGVKQGKRVSATCIAELTTTCVKCKLAELSLKRLNELLCLKRIPSEEEEEFMHRSQSHWPMSHRAWAWISLHSQTLTSWRNPVASRALASIGKPQRWEMCSVGKKWGAVRFWLNEAVQSLWRANRPSSSSSRHKWINSLMQVRPRGSGVRQSERLSQFTYHVPVYAHCPSMIVNSPAFTLKMPRMDDKLYGSPPHKRNLIHRAD